LPLASNLWGVTREVSFEGIVAAKNRIASGIVKTPCEPSPLLSEICDCEIYGKAEYLQRTGSFKERGARNALLLLPMEAKRTGVVAASAGNHAMALAYHGRDLGIPVTVVMPEFAPLVKQVRTLELGAKVLLSGANIGEAKDKADTLVAEQGLTYVHGFDGIDVINGQGSLGLEILEQISQPDAIIVPIGGGGLIAGLGLAVKTMAPSVEIIGVEPENAASYVAALEAGRPVRAHLEATLGDGLAVPTVGENAFAIARQVVDRTIKVSEGSIALAILRILELNKGVVEGAGATPLAALLSNQLPHLKGKRVVLALAGGNIDPGVLGRVIENGLVQDGRVARFRAVISDRPGGLAALAQAIAATGASVRQIGHERAFASPDVSKVEVICTVETRDHAHIAELHAALESKGIRVK